MGYNARLVSAFVVVIATALFLHVRRGNEIIADRESFSSFPRQLGDWEGTDATIPADSLAVLGPGDFLLRRYRTPEDQLPVDLFLAYFPTQRAGDTMHSPKHCLPGEGWLPTDSREISLSLPGRAPFRANRYLITKSGQRALVIYWYQSRNRALAGEYESRFYLVADAVRFNRSDGALIRVSSLLAPDESATAAERRLLALLDGVVPVLGKYIPL